MPAVIRPALQLQTYPSLPGSRSDPQLALAEPPSYPLGYHIRKRFSNGATSFGNRLNLAPWRSIITEPAQTSLNLEREDASPISTANKSAVTMMQPQMHYVQQQQHQHGDFGPRGGATMPLTGHQTKRGLFGGSRHTDIQSGPNDRATSGMGHRDGMREINRHDDADDDASIFTTDLRRKGSTKTVSGNNSNPSSNKMQHAPTAPLPATAPSTGSRIAQFFGKSGQSRKAVARPSTTDTNAGGPPPPFGQARIGQHGGINVRVEADNGTLIYDNEKDKLVPRPSDVSFDPTMEARQMNEGQGNNLLSPAGKFAGNRLRTASGPATPQHQLLETHPMPTKATTNRPFGFGTKSRQASQPNPPPAARSGPPAWKHPHAAISGAQDYPRTRAERNFRFTWEANPGIVDGKQLMGFGGEFGRKRVKTDVRMDASGKVPDARGATEVKRLPYVMGYERSVLDCEAMIHEAYTQICSGKATHYPDNLPPPKRILDLGCGAGLWPIAMAQQWPEATIVGLDIAPIQTDLLALARAQALVGMSEGVDGKNAVDWEDLSKRVSWKIGNFLDGLPFEAESFDFVHLRFVGLGIPETAWENLLDECARVLKRGNGILEIVEMSKVLPAKTPMALRASFSSLMLSSFLQPYPFVTLRPALLSCGLSAKEAMNVTFRRSQLTEWHPASTIEQCLAAWVDSALGKGKHGRGRGMSGSGQGVLRWGEQVLGEQAVRAYESIYEGDDDLDKAEAALSSTHESQRSDEAFESDEMTIVAWIVRS